MTLSQWLHCQRLIDHYEEDIVGFVRQQDKLVRRQNGLTNTPVKQLAIKYGTYVLINGISCLYANYYLVDRTYSSFCFSLSWYCWYDQCSKRKRYD